MFVLREDDWVLENIPESIKGPCGGKKHRLLKYKGGQRA